MRQAIALTLAALLAACSDPMAPSASEVTSARETTLGQRNDDMARLVAIGRKVKAEQAKEQAR